MPTYFSFVLRNDDILDFDSKWDVPWGWGPQGTSQKGGGGLAMVPNLRACKHLFESGGHTQGEGEG